MGGGGWVGGGGGVEEAFKHSECETISSTKCMFVLLLVSSSSLSILLIQ